MKLLFRTALASLIPIAAANALGLDDSTVDTTCESYCESQYGYGYADGKTAGINVGFGQGVAACVADPLVYGVTLASCIPAATYGETEPNDSLITADPLTLEVAFWGQNYSTADQDWYYTQSTVANQNLTLSFAVPDWIEGADLATGNPGVWNVSVRDAAGNVFANFNTDVVGALSSNPNAATYTVTLGLVGTYYILVQSADKATPNQFAYSITAFLQDSSLDNDQPVAGFYDSEIEPNNLPSASNPLATGVAMYGLINLTFNDVSSTEGEWLQGENDWYVYYSDGNEIVTITFCAKDDNCLSSGWYVDLYDNVSAQKLEEGEESSNLLPLLAFNTDAYTEEPLAYRIGLKDPGYYFMRVNHKRVLSTSCMTYHYSSSTTQSGLGDPCECSDSVDSCDVPTDGCSDADLGLTCNNQFVTCKADIDAGCLTADGKNGRLHYPSGCGVDENDDGVIDVECDTYKTLARCACSSYSTEVVSSNLTLPYNFTWYGTKLPTNTIDTDAYEDYLNRPSPY